MLTIRLANSSDLNWINDRYAEVDFVPSVIEDEVIGIAEINGQKVGLGRLVAVDEKTYELGGIYVLENFRNKGIARQIIQFLKGPITPFHTVYCIPFEPLLPLYQACGFVICPDDKAPSKMQKKLQWCRTHYSQSISFMALKPPVETSIEFYESEPDDFKPIMEVVVCYLEVNDRYLVLQRTAHKREGTKWGMPAGQIEPGETPEAAVRREVFEESGISLATHTHLEETGVLYIRKPGYDYRYHMFGARLDRIPDVHLSAEHIAYKWVTVGEMKELDMMIGAEDSLHMHLERFVK